MTPCSNAVNGNVKDGKEEESGGCEYKFSLPPDEEGIVYQCHLCSYTATTRVNFNAHVNTHYDFQCVKCDFEDKVSTSTQQLPFWSRLFRIFIKICNFCLFYKKYSAIFPHLD